jgi:RND family efflux transporter MFP subunit
MDIQLSAIRVLRLSRLSLPVGVVALFLTACGGGHPAPDLEVADPVTAALQVVEASEVPVYEEVVGTVRPRKEAQVAAKVTGRILTIDAIPGTRVKTGDVIAKIDVGELDASLTRAEAALAQAERDLARFLSLRESGAIAIAEYEQAESRERMAAASVQEMKTLVDNATINAPFDGTITRRYLEPGDFGAPGRPLFSMEDSSLLRLEINVAEALSGTMAVGGKLRVEIGGADANFEGVISEVAPAADVGSRTFLVKLDLPPNDALRAGQFGRAFLPRGERTALSVPDSALISRGQMDYVFVSVDNVARLRIVRTGQKVGGETEILAGLDSGESVVLDPPASMQDGQPLVSQP